MNKNVLSKLVPIDSDLITRGIYIDFEQRIKEDIPQIAGVLIDDEYTCYVVDPRLENTVKNLRIKRRKENWNYIEAKVLILKLLDKAESEERRIIGYSNTEINTIVHLIGDEKRIKKLYFNANMATWFKIRRKKTYKRLKAEIKTNESRWNKRVGLKDFLLLDYIDYNYPMDLIHYSPGKSLGDTICFLEERSDYDLLPKGIRNNFSKLYPYNMHDCFGMKYLLEYRLSRGDKILL